MSLDARKKNGKGKLKDLHLNDWDLIRVSYMYFVDIRYDHHPPVTSVDGEYSSIFSLQGQNYINVTLAVETWPKAEASKNGQWEERSRRQCSKVGNPFKHEDYDNCRSGNCKRIFFITPIVTNVARLQNVIPSFPWIAPPHPPPWRNPRKGRDQILQRSVVEP